MLLLLVALLLAGAFFLAAEAVTLPNRRRRDVVRRVATYGSRHTDPIVVHDRSAGAARLADPFVALAATLVLRLMPKTSREMVNQRLLSAGLAPRFSPDQLLAAKALATAFALFLGILLGSQLNVASAFVFGLALGAIGFLAPDLFVNSRIRGRREVVLSSLPDTLDLLAVSVEAGLGFDAALAKLIDYMSGPLIDEFALALNEMRLGETRAEALRRLAARMEVPELSSFIRAVIQSDQLGTSMAHMLRVQAADARIRRQLAAEEKAAKAPIKMLFPLMVFIFPALFILVLGPILITIRTTL